MAKLIAATLVLGGGFMAQGAVAQTTSLTLTLNYAAGGDHSPIYYALQEGWYEEAGVDLTVEPSNGSGAAASSLSVGRTDIAIIDMPTALQFKGEGADIRGVFVAYNDSPYGLYWKKSSGIETVADLEGRTLGAPAFDAARQMWDPIARALGLEPDAVNWVNIQPTAKVSALQSGTIDATSHFYSVHFIYEDVFGDDLGYALLRDQGLNPYGLTYFINNEASSDKTEAIEAMVHVTQRAFGFCLETPQPCAAALADSVSMTEDEALQQLRYAARVMPGQNNNNAIGGFEASRVQETYDMVQAAFEVESYDPESAYTNEFIDTTIEYPEGAAEL